jgi:hypothetical protein
MEVAMFLPVVLAVGLSPVPAAPAPDPQKPAGAVQKAVGSVEWKDAKGDVGKQNTSDGQRPGFDLVKLALTSDGAALTITATLAAAPKVDFASNVVQLYIDTDDNPVTGAQTFWSKRPGFELRAQLSLCIEYANGGKACSGGLGGTKVKGYYSKVEFGKLDKTGNVQGFYKAFKEPTGTVQGAAISASLPYKDLGVKPGQTIRVLAREADGPYDETADFPVTLLTLK